jgi:hypothetical protein
MMRAAGCWTAGESQAEGEVMMRRKMQDSCVEFSVRFCAGSSRGA